MLQLEVTDSTLDLLYRELDQTPDDRNLLLAIADRHEELGTGLSRGFQALVACRRVPWYCSINHYLLWWRLSYIRDKTDPAWEETQKSSIPDAWFNHMKIGRAAYCGPDPYQEIASDSYRAAAEAFNLLTLDQQKKLLQGDMNI